MRLPTLSVYGLREPVLIARPRRARDPGSRARCFSACAGSPTAQDRLPRPILSIAMRILRNRAEAQEALQDVFLYIHRKSALFEPARGTVGSWVLQVASSKSLNCRKQGLWGSIFFASSNQRCRSLALPGHGPAASPGQTLRREARTASARGSAGTSARNSVAVLLGWINAAGDQQKAERACGEHSASFLSWHRESPQSDCRETAMVIAP
jgi:DNA-directed RNA polymerase specialized sigma24 family protein